MKIKQLADGPYDPNKTETNILEYWLENSFYKPETAQEILGKQGIKNPNKFTIINPPPNAYAKPHMGNVSGYAYQDVFGRRARMLGKKVLMFPGKDHAAQQAEIVYIRDVLAPQGKSKDDFTRDEFYAEAYSYFNKIMKIAQDDEKRIGLSSDFDRDLFTLDPRVAATVYNTFSKMWSDSIVYKGVRIVNWSPGLNSAVADIDTERKEIDSHMYYIKYALPESAKGVHENIKKISTDLTSSYTAKVVQKNKIKNTYLAKVNNNYIYFYSTSTFKENDEINLINIGWSVFLKGSVCAVAVTEENKITGTISEIKNSEIFKAIFNSVNVYDKNIVSNQIPNGSAFLILEDEFTQELNEDDKNLQNKYAKGFIIGTVRPETVFGDTAIAVNPNDERFLDMIEQKIKLNSAYGEIELLVIADPGVDKEFGTGLLKLTPAHSATDYEIYLRYNNSNETRPINYKNVIGKDSKLNHLCGKYEGMHAEDDRDNIANSMEDEGFVVFKEKAKSNIVICERTKTIIQPIMSSQWFIDTDKLKLPALDAVEKEDVKIYPEYMTKKLGVWLKNLRDWPISRSIWWGYRIPVWYKGEITENTDANGNIVLSIGGQEIKNLPEAVEKGLAKLSLPSEFNPILIPGRFAPENANFYAEIKKKYPWAEQIYTGEIDQTFADYEKAFAKTNFENRVVVAHSLGAPAIIDYILDKKIKIKSLILIAPSNPDSANFNSDKDRGFWKNIERISDIANFCENVTVIYSDNDEHFSVQNFKDFIQKLGEGVVSVEELNKAHFATRKYSYHSEELANLLAKYESVYKAEKESLEKDGWVQDNDVFDTWFSSGQWPIATLTAEGLMDYYPTDVMETGYDILELWISRMLMLGLYLTGEVPFKNVYLHGLIKGEDGQKMSKSKGNLVYTEDIISEYGADALRMMYIVGNKAGAGYKVDRQKLKGYRNFLNKIWNVSRFTLSNLGGSSESDLEKIKIKVAEIKIRISPEEIKLEELQTVAKIKITELLEGKDINLIMQSSVATLLKNVDEHFTNFRIGMAAEEIYMHFWHVFADIYIEQIKSKIFLTDREGNPIQRTEGETQERIDTLATLLVIFQKYLQLLHPFIPFLTEEIWQHIPSELKDSETIMYSQLATYRE